MAPALSIRFFDHIKRNVLLEELMATAHVRGIGHLAEHR
jgi:hypothetical protein